MFLHVMPNHTWTDIENVSGWYAEVRTVAVPLAEVARVWPTSHGPGKRDGGFAPMLAKEPQARHQAGRGFPPGKRTLGG